MVEIIWFVASSAVIYGVTMEIHSRLQTKVISKAKGKLTLLQHYFLMLLAVAVTSLAIFPKLFMFGSSFELNNVQTLLLEFCLILIIVVPSILVNSKRYPDFLAKLESWRKNT
jgi:hypothetical protein